LSVRTTQDIADHVAGQLIGSGDLGVDSLEELGAAGPGQLTFIGDETYAARWADCRASAALISRDISLEPGVGRALIAVDSADLAMAKVLELFAPPPVLPSPGIHATAVVDPQAEVGNDVRIGPGCVIGPQVRIGQGCILHANVTLLDGVRLGAATEIWPGVVIRERCSIGGCCIIHANAVIGADGFGYRPDRGPDGIVLVKIPQIAAVRIGDDVEIGACTTIDRGKFSDTEIGDGCKIDNHVQIGHNCRLGKMVIIAGNSGIAGSVTIEDGAILGGMVGVTDHITIGAGAKLAGGALLIGSVPPGATWAGTPARDMGQAVREYAAIRRLPEVVRKVKKL
jgi:UDP-3-O-[3-hydroxymyristoyl] glucosamine N-acyltransferase